MTVTDSAKACYAAANYSGTDGLNLALILDKLELVKSSQRTAVHGHLERILKQPEQKSLVTAAQAFAEPIRALPVSTVIESVSNVTDASSERFVQGWQLQLWRDLVSLFLMGEIGSAMLDRRKVLRDLITLCTVVVQSATALSARVRCSTNK